uniref:Uncharacterized protein n=1 Tax=Glossina austeni TaxID=7395 RepID=A0A1A9VHD3_GLOAU
MDGSVVINRPQFLHYYERWRSQKFNRRLVSRPDRGPNWLFVAAIFKAYLLAYLFDLFYHRRPYIDIYSTDVRNLVKCKVLTCNVTKSTKPFRHWANSRRHSEACNQML